MSGLSHIAQSERSDIEAIENELMARQQDVAELSAEVELLRAERDEAVERAEQAEGALQREQTLRLELDNSVSRLMDAIGEHRRLILERVPQKSGRKIDEALWWWIK